MVNREKYHNPQQKLIDLTKLPPSELENRKLIDLREYLEKNFKEIVVEMDNSERYSKWIEPGINTCFVDFLKYKGKKVGFVAIDVGHQNGFINPATLNLAKVYILKEYRGKRIFPNYVSNLLDLALANYVMISFSEPNKYTINSLLREKLLLELPNGLIIGKLGLLFTIRTKTKITDNTSVSVITPYYDSNLFAPVQLLDGELIVGSTCFIDEWDFNAKEIREYYSNSEKYMRKLGEEIMEIGKIVDKLIMQEIYQTNTDYGKCEL